MVSDDAAGEDYRTQIEQGLGLARQRDSQDEIAFSLWLPGVNRYVAGDFYRAMTVRREALDLHQTLGDDFYGTEAVVLLGICARSARQMKEANSCERQAREHSRRSGTQFARGRALGSQGLLVRYQDLDSGPAVTYMKRLRQGAKFAIILV